MPFELRAVPAGDGVPHYRIYVRYPDGDRAGMAVYENWFWKESFRFFCERAASELRAKGVDPTTVLPPSPGFRVTALGRSSATTLGFSTYSPSRARVWASAAPAPNIAVIAIDDDSIGKLGRWPWPRDYHAALIDKLSKGGASVIGTDAALL